MSEYEAFLLFTCSDHPDVRRRADSVCSGYAFHDDRCFHVLGGGWWDVLGDIPGDPLCHWPGKRSEKRPAGGGGADRFPVAGGFAAGEVFPAESAGRALSGIPG